MIFLLKGLVGFNTIILRLGRKLAWIAIGLMVIIILIQVFFRYGLNSALPWPDEAARFLMLWMTGFIAPSAYRWGGFVSIDMLLSRLPSKMGNIASLMLLMISLLVLVIGLQFGLKHVESGWLFSSSSLKWPLHLIGMEATRVKLAWMYMSLPVGLALMTLVNVELIIKNFLRLWNPDLELPMDPDYPKTEEN
ncbi:MAG TPA: TRAP transporter small permease subunit [Verrucomicrobia bacterium]|jgi:TRAP-type C4-dicarboxylate transport system permease small subunit|nr:TRAP transporter small permease subunit [Verrucomicrobiota bacterium]|tara:strand:- start:3368 stop:3946 length:579 start_codon:yes stop_codon:yes gene_type:complete